MFDRPLSLSDILDDAFAVVRAQPVTLLIVTLVVVLPVRIAIAWLTRAGLGGASLPAFLADPEGYADVVTDQEYLTAWVLDTLAVVVLVGVLAQMVEAWWRGGRPGVGSLLRRLPRLLLHVPSGMAVLAPVMLTAVVPGMPAMFWVLFFGTVVLSPFAVLVAAAMVEGVGPWRAWRRARRLTRKRHLSTAWTFFMATVIVALLQQLLPLLFTGAQFIAGQDFNGVLIGIGIVLTALLVAPFVAAVVALVYFDLRVRAEGLDIELALVELRSR